MRLAKRVLTNRDSWLSLLHGALMNPAVSLLSLSGWLVDYGDRQIEQTQTG